MKAVVQRVKEAWVEVDGRRVGEIGAGALVLLGVARGDGEAEVQQLANKLLNLRIFDDPQGRMNLSLLETGGSLLVVSQFTLLGDCRKGRRPSYADAAPPEVAERLYESFLGACRKTSLRVAAGVFRAHMAVGLVNDGPVTLIVESG